MKKAFFAVPILISILVPTLSFGETPPEAEATASSAEESKDESTDEAAADASAEATEDEDPGSGDEEDVAAKPAPEPKPVAPKVVKPKVSSSQPSSAGRAKGRVIHAREAEGTEALGRFQADTVIHSEYYLDGRQLEVDPD